MRRWVADGERCVAMDGLTQLPLPSSSRPLSIGQANIGQAPGSMFLHGGLWASLEMDPLASMFRRAPP